MTFSMDELAILFRDSGIQHSFGVVGSGASWRLVSKFEAGGGRFFECSHEASAAIMAGAVSRVTSGIGIAVSIKGPGVANMLPGLIYNWFEGNPMIACVEAYGSAAQATRMHKRMNSRDALRPFVKGIVSISSDRETLLRSFEKAKSENPAPLALELAESANEISFSTPIKSLAESGLLEKVQPSLKECRTPIVIVGALAAKRTWGALLEKLKIPVFTTAAAKGVVNEHSLYSAGVYTGDGGPCSPETSLIHKADLIIGLGLRTTEILTPRPFENAILLDEISGLTAGFNPKLEFLNTTQPLFSSLISSLFDKDWGADEIRQSRQKLFAKLNTSDWLPYKLFAVLNESKGRCTYVLDDGNFCTIAEHCLVSDPDHRYIGSGKSRYVGSSVPTALGVAIADSSRPVICIMGDAGVRSYIAEIKLAVREKLPVFFLLISDGRYGSVCQTNPHNLSLNAVNIVSPSWWRIVEQMGCPAIQINRLNDFISAFGGWDRRGPLFAEASFDTDLYATMCEEIR